MPHYIARIDVPCDGLLIRTQVAPVSFFQVLDETLCVVTCGTALNYTCECEKNQEPLTTSVEKTTREIKFGALPCEEAIFVLTVVLTISIMNQDRKGTC